MKEVIEKGTLKKTCVTESIMRTDYHSSNSLATVRDDSGRLISNLPGETRKSGSFLAVSDTSRAPVSVSGGEQFSKVVTAIDSVKVEQWR